MDGFAASGLEPYKWQCAGHKLSKTGDEQYLGLLQDNKNRLLLKPVQAPPRGECETQFYERIWKKDADDKDDKLLLLRPFLPKYYGIRNVMINGRSIEYMQLEDAVATMKRPCVVDIKIGEKTWDPAATTKKIEGERVKCPYAERLCFRLLAMIVYKPEVGSYVFRDKDWGRDVTEEQIPDCFAEYFEAAGDHRAAIIDSIVEKLRAIEKWFSEPTGYAFYSSSILLAYDSAIDDDNNGINGAPRADVRMIDFAHVVDHVGRDTNYLNGMRSVIKFVEMQKESASGRLLIKGGQVVNDDAVASADVFIEDGIIKQVGPNLSVPGGARIIEAKGKYVFPGGIDTNTNFQLSFMGATAIDDFYSGTKAALAGGTTMIIANVVPEKGDSLLPAFERWRGLADSKVCCDYGLSVSVPQWSEKAAEEMAKLASNGINSFQFVMEDAQFMFRDGDLYRAFQQCKRVGALARVHAGNGDLIAAKEKEVLAAGVTGPEGFPQSRCSQAEIEATARACVIADEANCPLYLVKVMSKGAADAIGDAKRKGCVVVGEAVAAGLFTDGRHYYDKDWRHAANFVMSPPLAEDPTTPKYLTQQLASGGELQVVASTHRAYTAAQKAAGKDDFTKIPRGVNGVEERMMVLWEKAVNTGRMDLMRFVAVTSTNAAKIFNVYPKKGRVAEGSDADLVIWDPNASKTISASSHHSQSDCNIFEGFPCRGGPEMTIAAGKVVYEDGQLHVTQGGGKFVPLPPRAPHLFSSVSARDAASRPIKVNRDAGVNAGGGASGGVGAKSPLGSGSSMTASSPSPPAHRGSAQEPPPPYIEPLMPTSPKQDDFYSRPLTKAGSRNMQDSTFALSGAQVDDEQGNKRTTRVSKPPGGESRGLW